MTVQVVTVSVDATRFQAAALKRTPHQRHVCGGRDRRGDRLGQRVRLAGESVRKVMSSAVLSVSEHTDVDDVRRLLVERRIHHVPVVRGREVVGVVRRGDVLAAYAHSPLALHAMEET